MTRRIVMKPGTVYKVRKPFPYSTLYKLVHFCEENTLRLGQAISIAIGNVDCFYIEDAELEKKINQFISSNSTGK